MYLNIRTMYYLNYKISAIDIFLINLSEWKFNSEWNSISNVSKSYHRQGHYKPQNCGNSKKHTDAHIHARHRSGFRKVWKHQESENHLCGWSPWSFLPQSGRMPCQFLFSAFQYLPLKVYAPAARTACTPVGHSLSSAGWIYCEPSALHIGYRSGCRGASFYILGLPLAYSSSENEIWERGRACSTSGAIAHQIYLVPESGTACRVSSGDGTGSRLLDGGPVIGEPGAGTLYVLVKRRLYKWISWGELFIDYRVARTAGAQCPGYRYGFVCRIG